MLHQVIIIKEPACTLINTFFGSLHPDTICFRFSQKLLKLFLLFWRKRRKPIFHHIAQHLTIRYCFLLIPILIRISVQARQTITVPIIPAASTEKIHQGICIFTAKLLCPRSTIKHTQHIQGTGSSINGVAPYQTLHAMSPSSSVSRKPFRPERIIISNLGSHANAPLTHFCQDIQHRNRAIHNGYWKQGAISQRIATYPPHMITETFY